MATYEQLSTALRNADAAGDAESAQALAQALKGMSAPTTVEKSAPEKTVLDTATGIAKAGGTGVLKGVIGMAGLPGDAAVLGRKAGEWLGKKITGNDAPTNAPNPLPFPTAGDITSLVEKGTGPLYKPQTRSERYAHTVGEFAPAAVAGPGGLARKAVQFAVVPGVASEAAGEATAGTKYEPYARVAGALGGVIAPSMLSRAVTPLPVSAGRRQMIDTLADEGVTSLTAGQQTNNKALRYAESILGDFPGSGGGTNRIQQEGQRQFTEAATRRAGVNPALAPEGMGAASPEVLAQNSQRLGNEFQRIAANNTLAFDAQFANDLRGVIREYQRVLPSEQRQQLFNVITDIGQYGNALPGTVYQETRSRLSRQAQSLRESDPTFSNALRGLRNALDDAFGRSVSPADREALQTARQQYGAQRTLEKSASRSGEVTAEGNITPANLRNTVATNNRGQYARGQGDFADLARAGVGVMSPLPNSGTGQRVAITSLLSALGSGGGAVATGGPGAVLGAALGAAAPAAAGRALMSRPAQAYLANQLMTRVPAAGHKPSAAAIAALLAQNPRPPLIEAK